MFTLVPNDRSLGPSGRQSLLLNYPHFLFYAFSMSTAIFKKAIPTYHESQCIDTYKGVCE
jgi:hypothetical protein